METRATKILIVDDEPDFTTGLRAVMAAKDYEVTVATTPTEAREATWSERPDLVLLGTVMPRGEPFLFHRWLRQTPQFADVPMIVIDAPVEKQLLRGWTKIEGMQLDADDYLVKPVDPEPLMALVEKLLDRATRRIKVLIVDDHAIVREGIRALLSLQKDMQVIGEAVNGEEAIAKVAQLAPDVVLMDIVMPVMGGLEATRRLSARPEPARVLMLSQYDDEENVLASSQVGAMGFVPKRSAGSDLLDGIRSVSRGQRFQPQLEQ